MAYYPLKVKDNAGTVHVVGDPRIADKANKESPTLTGVPTAPTASVGTNTTQIATTAFVNAEIASDAVAKSTVTAKGDLIVASGSAAVDELPVGTNGQVLIADSTQTLGLRWGTISSGSDPLALILALT